MSRRLPPLNALRAFEAAARNQNFTRAAEELGVSQVAVSQQVKSLEAILGLKLFARDGKRLVITSAGQQYLAVLRDALDRIAIGTDRLLRDKPSRILTVTASPDFGAKWLVHDWDALLRCTQRLICASQQRASKSTSLPTTWISRSGMVMDIGKVSTRFPFVRNGSCRFAAPNSFLALIALRKLPTS
jgi:hypothetical protein